jgi:hypothetical protein
LQQKWIAAHHCVAHRTKCSKKLYTSQFEKATHLLAHLPDFSSWRRLGEMTLMGTVITCLAFQTWKKNHWDFSDKTALAEGQEIDLH